MNLNKSAFPIFVLILNILAGCDPVSQEEGTEYIVIESYAVANRPLPDVLVSTTSPLDKEYNFFDSAITGADVRVFLLSENGTEEEMFEYRSSDQQGIYSPESSVSHTVLGKRTYRLEISFPDRPEVLRAETTVPDTFEIINEIPDTLVYQSENQLEITLSPTEKTLSQNVFVFSAIAFNPEPENLTPFYKASVEDNDVDIENFFVNSSGIINEGNFDLNPDGSVTLRFPWLGVAFYEENDVVANSIDKNLYDFVRSQQAQLGGGSTLSPGEIPNLIYNVEGGIGVFGSLASDTVQTYFKRPF